MGMVMADMTDMTITETEDTMKEGKLGVFQVLMGYSLNPSPRR